jgi:hypothetical protein
MLSIAPIMALPAKRCVIGAQPVIVVAVQNWKDRLIPRTITGVSEY